MDATDQRILNLFQADARMTLREIGEWVNLTPPSVSERIHKLEDEGIIEGYRIAINRAKLGFGVGGYILASPEPAKYAAFCAFCEEHPAVTEHHHLIGTYNALLRFSVRDTDELDALLSVIKTFGDSRTSVELSSYFHTKDLPFGEDPE